MHDFYSVKRLPKDMRTQGIERNSNLEGDSDLCNSADELTKDLNYKTLKGNCNMDDCDNNDEDSYKDDDTEYKIVWHVRHGQSTVSIIYDY